MNGRQIFYRKCIKQIDALAHLFTKELQYICISKTDNDFRLSFINKSSEDCTDTFINTHHRGESLYDKILSIVVNNIPNINNIGIEMLYLKFIKKSEMGYVLNNDTFFNARRNLGISVPDLCDKLNLSTTAIYNAENHYKDISASTLLRYSIHFDIPITDFFKKNYKKTLEDSLLKRLLKHEHITLEQYNKIINNEN